MIFFIFLTVVGSLLVSYTKARAEGLGIECKTGLLARPERVVILAIGLLSQTGIWALALLAVLTHVTSFVSAIVGEWWLSGKKHTRHQRCTTLRHVTRMRPAQITTIRQQWQRQMRPRKADFRPLHASVPPFT